MRTHRRAQEGAGRSRRSNIEWFWSLLGNPMVLGLVALLGGWAVYRRRQPKPEQAHGFQNSLLSQEHTVIANANSLFGPAGAQNINVAAQRVRGDFRVGGGDNNDVDPIAEADVYIAYGRDVQAEEILREAGAAARAPWPSASSCWISTPTARMRMASSPSPRTC
nr:hypothetical protein [Ralstonia solanacearum]